MLNCPNCDKPLFRELIDTEWANNTYYDEVEGRCPHCNKTYRWIEMFEFSHVIDFHEVENG